MKYKVIVADSFDKPAKKLAKRDSSFPQDLLGLIDELENDPLIGIYFLGRQFA